MKRAKLIENYYKLLYLKNYSPETIKCYFHQLDLLMKYFKTDAISKVTSQDLLTYFIYLKEIKSFSYSSLKQAVAAIDLLYSEILKKKMNLDIFTRMKVSDCLPVILSIDEIKKILDSLVNLKHKTIISTIYSCGLRISEVINLKICDIDLSALTIKVENPQSKNSRCIMLSEKLLRLLHKYFKENKPKEYLFEQQDGKRYSARSIEEIFNRAVKLTGITKKVAIHTLRHSFASHLLDTGIDIHLIQKLLGHKYLSTTQIYTQINPVLVNKIKSPFDLF